MVGISSDIPGLPGPIGYLSVNSSEHTRAYGVEVKNTLTYIDREEFDIKIRMCKHLGITPMFVARMLPRTWIHDLNQVGGFALIFKWQLYPLSHKELADRVKSELGIRVDAPRALADGTMKRFTDWH